MRSGYPLASGNASERPGVTASATGTSEENLAGDWDSASTPVTVPTSENGTCPARPNHGAATCDRIRAAPQPTAGRTQTLGTKADDQTAPRAPRRRGHRECGRHRRRRRGNRDRRFGHHHGGARHGRQRHLRRLHARAGGAARPTPGRPRRRPRGRALGRLLHRLRRNGREGRRSPGRSCPDHRGFERGRPRRDPDRESDRRDSDCRHSSCGQARCASVGRHGRRDRHRRGRPARGGPATHRRTRRRHHPRFRHGSGPRRPGQGGQVRRYSRQRRVAGSPPRSPSAHRLRSTAT